MPLNRTSSDIMPDVHGSPCALCGTTVEAENQVLVSVNPFTAVPLHPECAQRVKDGENIPNDRIPRGY